MGDQVFSFWLMCEDCGFKGEPSESVPKDMKCPECGKRCTAWRSLRLTDKE